MTDTLSPEELRVYARVGARAQLETIYEHFPELRETTAPEAARPRRRAPKKKHWTQTPAGKLKMAAAQRKAWRDRRAAEGR